MKKEYTHKELEYLNRIKSTMTHDEYLILLNTITDMGVYCE